VFCPHCRKLARFPQATLMRGTAVFVGALCLPLAIVLTLGLGEARFAVPMASLAGLALGWFFSGYVISRFGNLCPKS
jgi:hypothetical protein